MKTLIKKTLTILAASLLIGVNAKASDNDKLKINLSEVSSTIKQHVKFPNVLLNYKQDEIVNVVFTVNEQGKVNLVIANTENEMLKKAIESQFQKLTLTQLKANNAYSIQFNFKTL